MDRGMRAFQPNQSGPPRQMMGQVPRPSAPTMQGPPPSGHTYISVKPPQQQQGMQQQRTASGPSNYSNVQIGEDKDTMDIKAMLHKDHKGSYITHVRIVEDSSSVSSRPAANSSGSHKKPRVLILCIRDSGRMQLHKAKEFKAGVFQVGRTWEFDELVKMEFDDMVPTGFILEMGKTYYWETKTPREKRNFCSKLIEEFIKYTNGKVPELVNCSIESLHLESLMARYKKIGSISKPSSMSKPNFVSKPSSPSPAAQHLSQTSVESEARKQSLSKLTRGTSAVSQNSPQKSTTRNSDKNIGVLTSPIKPPQSTSIAPIGSNMNEKYSRPLKNDSTVSAYSSNSKESKPISNNENFSSPKPLNYSHIVEPSMEDTTTMTTPALVVTPLNNTSTNEKPERPLSASSIEFVAHRKSLHEVEEITSSHSDAADEYEDFFEDYTDSLVPEAATTPLQIRKSDSGTHIADKSKGSIDASFNLSRELENLNDSFEGMKAKGDFSFDRGDDTMTEQPSINISVIQDDEPIQAKSTKLNAASLAIPEHEVSRARAHSKVYEQDNSNFVNELFDEIDYNELDDATTLTRKIIKELNKLENHKMDSLTDSIGVIEVVANSVDVALSKCDLIESTLSFFSVELGPLADDIHHIEKQGNNLQIQTTNRKLLRHELVDILSSVSISNDKLAYLTNNRTKLNKESISNVESILVELYSALVKMRGSAHGQDSEFEDEIGDMRALKERKIQYEETTNAFANNFKAEIIKFISSACLSINSRIGSLESNSGSIGELLEYMVDKFSSLLSFGGIMLFIKNISTDIYDTILEKYETEVSEIYNNLARKMISIAQESTSVEVKSFSLKSAPKDTFSGVDLSSKVSSLHKHSGQSNILETLGLVAEPKLSSDTISNKSMSSISDSLCSLLDQCHKAFVNQQDFYIRFFHVSSTYSQSFPDFVSTSIDKRVSEYTSLSLSDFEKMEADIALGDIVFGSMSAVFQNGMTLITKYFASACKRDYLQLPPVCSHLFKLRDNINATNYSYLKGVMSKIQSQLIRAWNSFIEAQAEIIANNNSVNTCRVLPTTKAFPEFVRRLENSFNEGRDTANDKMYQIALEQVDSLWRQLYSSLRRIANPDELQRSETHSTVSSHRRPSKLQEDDELSLEDHLVLLLNYKWLSEQCANLKMLSDKAKQEMNEFKSWELNAYCRALSTSKSIGKLIEFVEGIESLTKPESKAVSGGRENVNPAQRNAYKPSVLKSILDDIDIGASIHSDCKDLKDHILDATYTEGDSSESKSSIIVSKRIESDLYNSAVTVLSAIYTSVITSRLHTVVDKYYPGIDIKFDRRVINYHFNKEFIDIK